MTDFDFSVVNQNGESVLVAGQLNRLVLTITNDSDDPVSLKGGSPVSEDKATTGPSSLYLSFGDLLDDKALKDVALITPGWALMYFPSPTPALAIAPAADRPIGGRASLTLTLLNVQAPDHTQPGQLTIDYYHLGDATDSAGLDLPSRRAPDGREPPSVSAAWVGTNRVTITTDDTRQIATSLTFTISNTSRTTPVVPPKTPWGADAPAFQVWIVCGKPPGYGALTDASFAAGLKLDVTEKYKDTWVPTPNLQAKPPYWILEPQNHEVLGTGAGASVEFTLSNIVTELDPGVTVMYIQYANLPGHDDGYLMPVMTIEKALPPRIVRFSADRTAFDFGGGPVQVVFSWRVENAELISLEGVGPLGQSETPQTFEGSRNVLVPVPASYKLFASVGSQDTGNDASPVIDITTIAEYLSGKTVSFETSGSIGPLDDERGEKLDTLNWTIKGNVSFSPTGSAVCNALQGGTDVAEAMMTGYETTTDLPPQTFDGTGAWNVDGNTVTVTSPQGTFEFLFRWIAGAGVLNLTASAFSIRGYKVPNSTPRDFARRKV